MNDLVVLGGHGVSLYEKMQTAIAVCHSIDDLLDISAQADAIAAYYKQLDDDESVRKFAAVKMRAVRRIGEIFGSAVSQDGCETQMDYIRKIRKVFPDHPVSNSRMYHVLKFKAVPHEFVEQCINSGNYYNCTAIIDAYEALERKKWEESPEGKAELERRHKEYKAQEARHAQEQRRVLKEKLEDEHERQILMEAVKDAFDEVGMTLERRDRKHMKQVILLIKDSIHETLRQAAFDNRITMQAVLRAGLAMWFIAHGYKIPEGLDLSDATPTTPPEPRPRPRR